MSVRQIELTMYYLIISNEVIHIHKYNGVTKYIHFSRAFQNN